MNNRFISPKDTAYGMVNIIAPLFGVSGIKKVGINADIMLKSSEEVNMYLVDVMKFLMEEYKKG